MERAPVSSSMMQSVGYDSNSQTLEIEFNSGSVYDYLGVPQGEFDAMMNSDSQGKYFNANIRGRYPETKL